MASFGNVFENNFASGAYCLAPSGTKFRTIFGTWNIPEVSLSNEDLDVGVAFRSCFTFMGIASGTPLNSNGEGEGGIHTASMVQLGVFNARGYIQYYAGDDYTIESYHKVFYRWVSSDWDAPDDPNNSYFIIENFPVSGGDNVVACICVLDTVASVYLTNLTNPNSTSFLIENPTGENFAGTCAGWGVGNGLFIPPGMTGDNQGIQLFGEYGTVGFNKVQATLDTGVSVLPKYTLQIAPTIDEPFLSEGLIWGGDRVVCEEF